MAADKSLDTIFSRHKLSFVLANPRSIDCPIIYASQNFFKTTGYAPEDILGKNCRILQGPRTSTQTIMEIRDAIREERATSVCILNYRKDGTPFWNAFYLSPVQCSSSHTIDFYIGIQADVTALVQQAGSIDNTDITDIAENEQRTAAQIAIDIKTHAEDLAKYCTSNCAIDESVPSSLISILGTIQGSFCLTDPSLKENPMVYCSPGFLKMTGYSCNELVGKNCGRMLQGPETDQAAVSKIRDALAAARPITVTLLNYKKNKSKFLNCVHIAPIRNADGKVQYYVGVQIDVTENSLKTERAAEASLLSTSPPLAAPLNEIRSDQHQPYTNDNNSNNVSTLQLLEQKGVVGSVRVAARALSMCGLRRSLEDQHQPMSPKN